MPGRQNPNKAKAKLSRSRKGIAKAKKRLNAKTETQIGITRKGVLSKKKARKVARKENYAQKRLEEAQMEDPIENVQPIVDVMEMER